MTRQIELQHLALANRHVAEAEARVARQQEWIQENAGCSSALCQGQSLLATMRRTLEEFIAHRALILQALGGDVRSEFCDTQASDAWDGCLSRTALPGDAGGQ